MTTTHKFPPLEVVGQLDVLDLHPLDDDAPGVGGLVQLLSDRQLSVVRVRKDLL